MPLHLQSLLGFSAQLVLFLILLNCSMLLALGLINCGTKLRLFLLLCEACLYGHINWSLAQAQQQSSIGLSQTFPSKRGGKARSWTGFHFTVQRRPVLESSGASLAKRQYLESRTETHPGGKKSVGGSACARSADARKRGDIGISASDVSQSTASSSSSSLVFHVGMLSHFLDQWSSITSNRFVLNMVQGHHFQLRSCPSLFCNFRQFNVKMAAAHHPIIQEEHELLSEGAIEPSSSGAGFYSGVFVVPKHTGGLRPILNLKQFNYYLHIPSFKMPTIRHVWQLIQHDDYAFSIDLQDAY